ncbi:hypothetical protein MRX96_004284 [Rhipicephalus microplus]
MTTKDHEDIIFRLRPLQNLAIISTSRSHVADALYRVRELRLGEGVYPITPYFAAPDNSCMNIVPGIVPGSRDPPFTHPDEGRRVALQEPIRKSKTCSKPGPTSRPEPTPNPGLASTSSCEKSRHPSETHAPSPSTLQPYKKALQSEPVGKEVHAFSERQRAPEGNTTKVAPREVDQVDGPPLLAPSRQSLPTTSPQTTKSSTPDPLAEIARLRRDMEARCERLEKQMDALVAEMGISMQAALDRIERRI